MPTKLEDFFSRSIAFSRATWGPGQRRAGVIAHIRKELEEIENNPDDGDPAKEWIDVIVLAADGLWRELNHQGIPWFQIPLVMAGMWKQKQSKNEQREWPNWREFSEDQAIEHKR